MTSESRTPEQIEQDIERERAGLTTALDDLQEKLSLDGIIRQVSTQLRDHGGEIGTALSRSIKQNPLALALTGAGIAWLMMGNNNTPDRQRRYADDDDDDRGYGRQAPRSRMYDRPATPKRMSSAHPDDWSSARTSQATDQAGPDWARRSGYGGGSGVANTDGTGTVSGKARTTYEAAGDKVSSMAGSVSDTARSVSDSVSEMAGTAQDLIGDAAHYTTDRANELRTRLAEGTESLGHEARERVIEARHKAIEARDAGMDQARIGRDRAVDMFDQQPLIAGAIALAFGAAIAAALPRTRTEDRMLGSESDTLFHDAEQIFAEERAKLTEVVKAAVDEAKSIADEVKVAAVDAAGSVEAKAKESGARIVDAAKTEADHQGIGKVDP